MPKVFENLWVKVAAILLAILLWFHVATEKTYQIEISLPLAQIEVSDDLVISEPPPDSITVLVSAIGKTLLSSGWKKEGVRLVVSGGRAAKFKTEVSPSNLSLVKMDKVTLLDVVQPREIVLSCERKMDKTVPVMLKLDVLPDDGYLIDGEPSILPPEVTLTGPRGEIKDFDYIETISKTIEGVRDKFSSRVALNRPQVYGLIIQPDTIVAYFDVIPIKRKEFREIAIKLINTPRGKEFTIKPNSINLRVAGKTETIDSVSAELFSAIADYVLADSNDVIPVQVIAPPGITLLHQSADSVKVIGYDADARN